MKLPVRSYKAPVAKISIKVYQTSLHFQLNNLLDVLPHIIETDQYFDVSRIVNEITRIRKLKKALRDHTGIEIELTEYLYESKINE